ncbi:hypothetical protein ACS0TY_032184 [Phlomoides rotata]
MVLLAGSKRCLAEGSSTMAEALALRFGPTRALEAGLGAMQAKMDSEILVRTCRGEHIAEAYVTTLVEDIKSMGNTVQAGPALTLWGPIAKKRGPDIGGSGLAPGFFFLAF